MNVRHPTQGERQAMREKRDTHWFTRVVAPQGAVFLEIPKCDPKLLAWGFLPVEMLHGATIAVQGAEILPRDGWVIPVLGSGN